MMLPILISLSVAPRSYFFCAAAGSAAADSPSTSNTSKMPRCAAMSTSPDAAGYLPISGQSRVQPPNLSSFGWWWCEGKTAGKRSAHGSDHVRPDPPLNGAVAKSQRQRLGAGLRGGLQAGRIARLDFISQRRSLAIGDRRLARRRRPADLAERIDRDLRKARQGQFFADFCHIVIAVRGAGHEARRIVREDRRQRCGDDFGEFIFGDLVPHVEKEVAARF